MKFVPAGIDAGSWIWSMLLTHPGADFKHPTNGRCEIRGQAVRELGGCYAAFRAYYGIEERPARAAADRPTDGTRSGSRARRHASA